MSDRVTAGDIVAAFLEACGVEIAFGVISIHNMPILDAIARRNRIRFVTSRGEAGACNMADAYARVHGGLGVFVTSTGTGAGNACGAMVEAQTAGTPVLHLTGQIERDYLDRGRGYIHEAADQLAMLKSVSKAAYRVWSPETLLGTLREAVRTALTPPSGPVSVEIPIDVQEAILEMPVDVEPIYPGAPEPSDDSIATLAAALADKRRPMVWLGGGARHAGMAAGRLAQMGFGLVTSVQGRGVVPEDHAMSLGAFNLQPAVEDFYATCDAMLVVGSRLRGNETLKYTLKLPKPLLQIDTDPAADGRSYPTDLFVAGDSAWTLAMLADRLEGQFKPDPTFATDLALARAAAEQSMRNTLGPYNAVVDMVQHAAPNDVVWVRDVTLSNSIWGNRMPLLTGPRDGVHALGGGIGQGLPMAIGAALGSKGRKTLALTGDGGLALCLGELGTAAQEGADLALIVMNDRGYGVIRNIQDAKYEGRRHYGNLPVPDFGQVAESMNIPHWHITDVADLALALKDAIGENGPAMVEVDMTAIGDFARPFAGPPVRKD